MPETAMLLDTCKKAAYAGAKELMQWRNRFSSREKSMHDLVTDADLASQEVIQKVIHTTFPNHGFLGEETPDFSQLDLPYCWIVDPLDGTTNYVHGFPCYAVSIAVTQRGQLVAGAIYDPLAEECFLATLAEGHTQR